jgi:hypothetical protein
MVIPMSEFAADRDAADPQNLVREVWAPSFEGLSAIAPRPPTPLAHALRRLTRISLPVYRGVVLDTLYVR